MKKLTTGLVLIGLISLATISIFHLKEDVWNVSFATLKGLSDPVVTLTSSGLWFLTLAVVGWKAGRNKPVAARAKAR